MKPEDFDKELECPVCGGDGVDPIPDKDTGETVSCRRCTGNGIINRYGDKDPKAEHDGQVVLHEEVGDKIGILKEVSAPISPDEGLGFEAIYGPKQFDPPSGKVSPDMKDRLQNNQPGANANGKGQYDLSDRDFPPKNSVSAEDVPSSKNPSADEIIRWMEARDETEVAEHFRKAKNEIDL